MQSCCAWLCHAQQQLGAADRFQGSAQMDAGLNEQVLAVYVKMSPQRAHGQAAMLYADADAGLFLCADK